LESIFEDGDSYILQFSLPPQIRKFVAHKGSICLNGISLTVSQVSENSFQVSIIPHTWLHTNLQDLKIGGLVNVEIDTIMRYLERLLPPNLK
jgi:riboflavin synthase